MRVRYTVMLEGNDGVIAERKGESELSAKVVQLIHDHDERAFDEVAGAALGALIRPGGGLILNAQVIE